MKLKPVTLSDSVKYSELRNGDETYKWFFAGKKYEEPEVEQWLERVLSKGDHLYFAIEGDEIIGTVAMYNIENNIAEAGRIIVAEKYRGKGHGVEMLNLLSKQAKEIKLGKLYAFIKKDNIASIRTFKKAGYEQQDEFDDRVYFSLSLR